MKKTAEIDKLYSVNVNWAPCLLLTRKVPWDIGLWGKSDCLLPSILIQPWRWTHWRNPRWRENQLGEGWTEKAWNFWKIRRLVFTGNETNLSWKKLANVSLCTTSTGWSTHSSHNASMVSTLATAPVVQSAFHPGIYLGCHRWALSSQSAFTKPMGNLWRDGTKICQMVSDQLILEFKNIKFSQALEERKMQEHQKKNLWQPMNSVLHNSLDVWLIGMSSVDVFLDHRPGQGIFSKQS